MSAEARTSDESLSRWVIAGLSFVVFAGVAIVIFGAGGTGVGEPGAILPAVNAALNASSGVFLIVGWRFIKRKRRAAHKACMLTAAALSGLFLVTYLLHHAQVGSVPFGGRGAIRVVYFAILIPHVVLAAVMTPMALTTIWRGWKGRFAQHKKLARWTLPIWLYVSVSGVVVYVMLYHS